MRDAELSSCCTAACLMRACALWCRLRASGVEGADMARSSVSTAMSFWLARGGVFGLLTLKSASMRSRDYLPSSRTRSLRVETSLSMVVRRSRTSLYSSVNLSSSLRAWANCLLMPIYPVGEVGCARPRFSGRTRPRILGCISVVGPRHVHIVDMVIVDSR
jgi:hypothetical protein